MDFSRNMSELEAGLLIGSGALIIFGFLIYMMSARGSQEEDDATKLYNKWSELMGQSQFVMALEVVEKYLIEVFGQSENPSELGEAFSMAAETAGKAGRQPLARFCAEIACHHLKEDEVVNYPHYRKCLEKSRQITVETDSLLSSALSKQVLGLTESFFAEKKAPVEEFLNKLKKMESH